MKAERLVKLWEERDTMYEEEQELHFELSVSRTSCRVSDIEAIVFGGTTSRFWMMRKYFNMFKSSEDLAKFPFYAWECISL